MYSFCIFDFDYTLGDSTDGIVESVNFALSSMGYKNAAKDEIRKTIGMALNDTFTYLTGVNDEAEKARFSALFVKKADEVITRSTVLFPDCIETLSKLKSRGVKTAIVTSKYHYRIDEILLKFQIGQLVDVIIGFEDTKNPKPHPEPLLTAAQKLGADLKDVLYVGDSVIDAKTAQAAHVDFAAVTTGATEAEAFSAYPHAAILSSLSELFSAG